MKWVLILSTAAVLFASPVWADKQETKPIKAATTKQAMMHRLDINQASLEQLVMLKGIGKKKASAIVQYRQKHGKFKKVDDLLNVKGIGEKALKHLRPLVKV